MTGAIFFELKKSIGCQIEMAPHIPSKIITKEKHSSVFMWDLEIAFCLKG